MNYQIIKTTLGEESGGGEGRHFYNLVFDFIQENTEYKL